MTEDYEREQRLREQIEAQLAPGEQLLWQGAPAKKAKQPGRVYTRIFGIVWLCFALFWETTAISSTLSAYGGWLSLIFPLFGLPFVAVGIYLVFVLPAKQRGRMAAAVYAVTDQRALIFDTTRGDLRSLPLSGIRGWNRQMRPDGSGDLVLETGDLGMVYRRSASMGHAGDAEPFAFYATDVREAERALATAGAARGH